MQFSGRFWPLLLLAVFVPSRAMLLDQILKEAAEKAKLLAKRHFAGDNQANLRLLSERRQSGRRVFEERHLFKDEEDNDETSSLDLTKRRKLNANDLIQAGK